MTIDDFRAAISDPDNLKALIGKKLQIKGRDKTTDIIISEGTRNFSAANIIMVPVDLVHTSPEKIIALLHSKSGLNKKVFARNCMVTEIKKQTAIDFLDHYHFMNSTGSAYNLGLFLKEELMAVASFSKGRKMNRLPENRRSFELIRFCCKPGITVTGGLTKLVAHFCKEKNAGDIMTYIDKQFSDGASFIKAGFVKHSETEPNYFLVNRKTFERVPLKDNKEKFDEAVFYQSQNSGNIKLVYTPGE